MLRKQVITDLRENQPYDLLIIGGGATGCGIALDAASRGLKTALVEKNDFSEGTSSRSTKLVHGGVRYLEKAVKQFDRTQYSLVREGLHERGLLLRNAPHLANRLPLVTPLYRWMEVPYVYAGLKIYDLLAGKLSIGHSRIVSRKEALGRFPMLKQEGLKAGVLYYDGQFNDARMAVGLVTTARGMGANIANHVEVVSLLKENSLVVGARVRDNINGEEFSVRSRGVINATGPFVDRIRRMDQPDVGAILKTSSGIHIVLDKRFAPPAAGLLIPKTDDGRVLFILPWQGRTLIGTTDEPAEITEHPRPKDEEVDYLLRHIRQYFNLDIRRADIASVWSGLRPLLHHPGATDTSHLTRDHEVQVSASKLLTIAGGKWTAYRRMARDAVDQAVAIFRLSPHTPCRTEHLLLDGAVDYQEHGDQELVRNYQLPSDVAAHLHHSYGSRAEAVAELARSGLGERLHPEYPLIEAEVVYVVRHEQAERVGDVLARRLPLALLDQDAAADVFERVSELMAKELDWDESRCQSERELFAERLKTAL